MKKVEWKLRCQTIRHRAGYSKNLSCRSLFIFGLSIHPILSETSRLLLHGLFLFYRSPFLQYGMPLHKLRESPVSQDRNQKLHHFQSHSYSQAFWVCNHLQTSFLFTTHTHRHREHSYVYEGKPTLRSLVLFKDNSLCHLLLYSVYNHFSQYTARVEALPKPTLPTSSSFLQTLTLHLLNLPFVLDGEQDS